MRNYESGKKRVLFVVSIPLQHGIINSMQRISCALVTERAFSLLRKPDNGNYFILVYTIHTPTVCGSLIFIALSFDCHRWTPLQWYGRFVNAHSTTVGMYVHKRCCACMQLVECKVKVFGCARTVGGWLALANGSMFCLGAKLAFQIAITSQA